MTNRTVKICGWGTGDSTAVITAWLDGEQIFSGLVNLVELNEFNQSEHTAPTLFAFDVPMDFVGTKHMKVKVEGATVRFAYITANYVQGMLEAVGYSSGADGFLDISGWIDGVRDARKNVVIDGKPQTVNRQLGNGAWHWFVDPGSVMEHDLVISAGAPG